MPAKIFVNPYMVGDVFAPFIVLEGSELDAVAAVDPNDEAAVRSSLRRIVVPYFNGIDAMSQEAIRQALRYLVIEGGKDWEGLLDDSRCHFSNANEPSRVFRWLWLELFDDESDLQGTVDDYVVQPNLEATNRIRHRVSLFHLSPGGK
jgi:hypothetical protein